MMQGSNALSTETDLAGQALDLIKSAAPDAQAAVSVARSSMWLTRFATSFIHQNVADDTTSVTLTVHLDGRTTMSSTTLTSADGLRDLVDRALGSAKLAPVDAAWPGLAEPAPLLGTGTADEATANATPAQRAEIVKAFVDAAQGREPAGYCRTLHWRGAYANTAGQSVAGEATSADFDGIAREGGADSAARLVSTRVSDLDGAVLGARVARQVAGLSEAVELPAGEYEVVLLPEAVADLLINFAFAGFNGKQHNENRSFARLGEQQFDPAVTLVDDAVSPGSVGTPYDAEGTPRTLLTLVDKGITAAVCHDRRSAAQAGTVSTGHASGNSSAGPMTQNLALAPGSKTVAELIASVRRGLLVTDFWYTRMLDPRQLTLTGLTRNGVWLIEDGQVTTPVKNFRFTQAYPAALAPGRVLGASSTAVAQPARWGLGSWTGPALHLAAWNFTGTASG
jgi:predicted Zn-dependent protease